MLKNKFALILSLNLLGGVVFGNPEGSGPSPLSGKGSPSVSWEDMSDSKVWVKIEDQKGNPKKIITQEEAQELIEGILSNERIQKLPKEQISELVKMIVLELVTKNVLLIKAKENQISNKPEVKKELESLKIKVAKLLKQQEEAVIVKHYREAQKEKMGVSEAALKKAKEDKSTLMLSLEIGHIKNRSDAVRIIKQLKTSNGKLSDIPSKYLQGGKFVPYDDILDVRLGQIQGLEKVQEDIQSRKKTGAKIGGYVYGEPIESPEKNGFFVIFVRKAASAPVEELKKHYQDLESEGLNKAITAKAFQDFKIKFNKKSFPEGAN